MCSSDLGERVAGVVVDEKGRPVQDVRVDAVEADRPPRMTFGPLRGDEEQERDELRPLGRRLVELVGDYLSRRGRRAQVEQEVDEIGQRYGQILHDRGTPLMRAVEAFTFFRRSLDETAKQLAERTHMSAEEAARARAEIAGLADRVLLGVTSAYDR